VSISVDLDGALGRDAHERCHFGAAMM